ncbi:MAG: hypothetical protein WCR56_07585 [Bacilli bacterium]
MNRNYTLAEIKAELLKEISQLEEKDPSWLICRHCPFKGKCCIDNDIDIREDEWQEIKEVLDKNPNIRKQVKDNFLHDSKCYFRTESCCLINDVRPTNCLYTPYQVIQNIYDQKLMYSLRSGTCDFITKEEDSKPLSPDEYLIPIKGTDHYYLFLNYWFLNYENQSIDCYKETGYERLKEYFQDVRKVA